MTLFFWGFLIATAVVEDNCRAFEMDARKADGSGQIAVEREVSLDKQVATTTN